MPNRGRSIAAEPATVRDGLVVVQGKRDLLDDVSNWISSSALVQVLETVAIMFRAIATRRTCVQTLTAAFRSPTVSAESGNAEALERQVL